MVLSLDENYLTLYIWLQIDIIEDVKLWVSIRHKSIIDKKLG